MEYHNVKFSYEFTRSHETRHIAEIEHKGLKEYRILKDMDKDILAKKIENQLAKWDARFEQKRTAGKKMDASHEANERTAEAKSKLSEIDKILIKTLAIDDKIEWEKLKNYNEYNIANPKNELEAELAGIKKPIIPFVKALPNEPSIADNEFVPKFTFIDRFSKSSRQKKYEKALKMFHDAQMDWLRIKEKSEKEVEAYYSKCIALAEKYEKLEINWEKEKQEYYNAQNIYNEKIDKLKNDYLEKTENAILQYNELLLNSSEYPDFFPKNFDLEYNSSNKILLVEYSLPSPTDFPIIQEVKYIANKDEFKEFYLSDAQKNKIFDTALYSTALRTIHEIFEADTIDAIDAVNFNGWIISVNKATGKKIESCIISVQCRKSEFMEIDLANVDPKACFKNLKGVSSTKLYGVTPIKPIMQIDKSDKRIVDSRNIEIDTSSNLAAMDWEDFEHLIREVFEKEFCVNGGEVKVTQASRDGGVDAIAFDPDPIRGGKIVIQAKRYTNVVSVSAVRDLFGTVMNEGATKGILVTTANYGPDAYEFAKGKPLTLLNGSNLLHLLEKHGQKARININEAREQMKDIQ